LFLFYDPATTQIYTLSLHDALPISSERAALSAAREPNKKPRVIRPGVAFCIVNTFPGSIRSDGAGSSSGHKRGTGNRENACHVYTNLAAKFTRDKGKRRYPSIFARALSIMPVRRIAPQWNPLD